MIFWNTLFFDDGRTVIWAQREVIFDDGRTVIGAQKGWVHFRGSITATCYWQCYIWIIFVYTHSLALLLASHRVDDHSYADDCQLYLPVANTDKTKTKVPALLSDIKIWMREQKLRLNETEIMLTKGNLRTNVTHEFGNLDAGVSKIAH